MKRKLALCLSSISLALGLAACGEDPPLPEENCALAGDEDLDGQADCDDDACALFAECQPRCGDGRVNVADEVCDDGNDVEGDGCDSNCTVSACNNGVVAGDEVCDDGNAIEGDGCDSNCTVSACGNDVVGLDEACDDANDVDGDGCDSDCSLTGCGNGIVTKNEGCDDGNDVDGDGCTNACAVAGCGDGVSNPTEECDDGNPDSGDGCDANCRPTGCGNGVLTDPEACDDGNLVNNDGCSSTCVIECGNGQVSGAEECDGSNFLGQNCITRGFIGGTIACTSSCMLDTSACVAAGCENGTLEPGEECEGANLGGQTCTSIGAGFAGGTLACDAPTCEFDTSGCTLPVCENGALEPGEQCEGTNLGGATCTSIGGFVGGTLACDQPNCTYDTSACIAPGCGNGILEIGEQCDDGDLDPDDGCDASCLIEGTIGEIEPNEDGTPQTGGSGTVGNDFNATAVANADANGAFDVAAGDGLITAALSPVGDEDVFAFRNSLAGPVTLRLDIYNFTTGIGQPCGTSLDSGLHIRDAAGVSQLSNDDRNGSADQCSGLAYVVGAGVTVYAHVVEFGDNAVAAGYGLQFTWTVPECGNGAVEVGEQCDDGGTDPDDGCSATCTVEGVTAEVEPNGTTAQADAAGLDITGDALISGAITDATDEIDMFRVVVATATVVRFETFTSLFDCDASTTTLRLRDAAGTEIVTDTSSGIRACSAIVMYLAAGTYYLQVEETGTNANVPFYFLQAEFQDDAGAESETPGTAGTNDGLGAASANLVGLNEVYVFGDHTLTTDDDWYAITVPAGARIRAEVIEGDRAAETCESFNMDADLTLFSNVGAQLVDDDADGRGFCPLIDGTGTTPLDAAARNATATTQTYFLRVQSYSTAAGNANQFVYRLQVTIR